MLEFGLIGENEIRQARINLAAEIATPATLPAFDEEEDEESDLDPFPARARVATQAVGLPYPASATPYRFAPTHCREAQHYLLLSARQASPSCSQQVCREVRHSHRRIMRQHISRRRSDTASRNRGRDLFAP